MTERLAPRLRLAELVAVIAMATDLGMGLPMEHAIRTCLLAQQLGRRVGMSEAERSDLYYLSLLRMLGCTTDSAEYGRYFGDEVEFARETQHLDYGDGAAFGAWVMQSFAADKPPETRQQMIETLFSYTPEKRQAALAGHCEVAQMLAARLGMSRAVIDGLRFVFERWDGTGVPAGVRGEDQPLGVRVMNLCHEVEVHHRLGGPGAAVAMARKRAGGELDPELVSVFCASSDAILAVIADSQVVEGLLAAEPEPHRYANAAVATEAGRVMGDFADLKSACFAGHSTRVAEITVAAAERLGLDDSERPMLELAALAHDLGRVAVTTAIWEKAGVLNDAERERVRLHAYYSERLLARAPSLARAAQIAGLHHERLDGSGYHRGCNAVAQPQGARILAAADAYVSMRQPRAHRPALEPGQAASELRRMAAGDTLDTSAVNAVLAAAGDTGPRVRHRWPADLTDREVEVLRRIAMGASIQQAATDLHVAPKTIDAHLQSIYSKAGITSRAAATLFAIQHGLLQAGE